MSETKKGVINAVIAFSMWGIYPLYWALLQHLRPMELLTNRIIWSFTFLFICFIALKKHDLITETLAQLRADKKKIWLLVLAAFFVGSNWFIYTYAVVHERIIEASLGYYINPILSILIGVIFLKEKLSKLQILASLIAATGVAFLAFSYGALPWLSLLLAISFGLYGLCKKLVGIDSTIALWLETMLLMPIAMIFFIQWLNDGTSTFVLGNINDMLLLIGAGFITVSPLFFFGKAARQIPLYVLGFLQYIGPTLKMIMATFILGESFSHERLIAFSIIWTACILFSLSPLFNRKKLT